MNKTKKAIIFGTGIFAEVVSFMLENDSQYTVAAFTSSNKSFSDDVYLGKPYVDFANIEYAYPPREYEIFIAVGYAKMNQLRREIMAQAEAKGYTLLSYVSSKVKIWNNTSIGKNVFIFEDNTIQPFTSIGDGCILWSGNHIGHHSKIKDNCFITSHVVVSGNCTIENSCFLGVNSTIIDSVTIAEKNLIGAAALITKNTKPNEVYSTPRAKPLNKTSNEFFL